MNIHIRRRITTPQNTLQHLPPLLRHIYWGRGIQNDSEIDYSIQYLLHYESLAGIQDAVVLLQTEIEKKSHILVIGDYDADGATSVALVVSVLRAMGVDQVSYLVPNRFRTGYGLTKEIVEEAHTLKADCLITVDTGITSFAGIEYARSLGMRVLITDHHLPAEHLPMAHAIVNPKLTACSFPSKNLAGVGVAFYLMMALRQQLRANQYFSRNNIIEPTLSHYLDLVALGTIADVVTLDYNNRLLVAQGLKRIQSGKACPGILALLKEAACAAERVNATDLAFYVAPRLNAAGRLEDMSIGVRCLLAEKGEANTLARSLSSLNDERKRIEAGMRSDAHEILQNLESKVEERMAYCLYDTSWHSGVSGILAGRIKDRYYRPTVIFADHQNDQLVGSARSIQGLNIRDIFADISVKYEGLIVRFGGHAMAAGLTIDKKNLSLFMDVFDQTVRENLSEALLKNVILTDGSMENESITIDLIRKLQASGPWGHGFEAPVFDDVFDIVGVRLVGDKFLKLWLQKKNDPNKYEAMLFQVTEDYWKIAHEKKCHAVYELGLNTYRDIQSVQLIIRHMTSTERERIES